MSEQFSDRSQAGESPDYVEYCLANIRPTHRARLEALDVETRSASCLDRCGTCYVKPFLIVDGTVTAGDSCEQLLDGCAAGEGRREIVSGDAERDDRSDTAAGGESV